MYTSLYFKFYNFLKSKKSNDPTFNASGLIFIMQLIHFLLVMLLLGKFFQFKVPSFSADNSTNKLMFFPIGILWLYFAHKFFSSKLKQTNLERISGVAELNTQKFVILMIVTILIPLYCIIILSGGQIWK